MAYQVGKDYTATMERRNAIGMWSKKVIILKGLQLSIHDSEGAPAALSMPLSAIQRVPNEPLCLGFVGTEVVNLRCADATLANQWYDLAYTALEVAGKVKPRNCGLPPSDPRNGLTFIEVKPEFSHAFQNLASCVLYWFEPVKKLGLPSKLTGRNAIEERIVFVSDQCIYVTKHNSELTRCMKIGAFKKLFTNVGMENVRPENLYMVIKMAPPEYDLCFQSPQSETFARAVCAVFRSISKGPKLPVETASNFSDPVVQLQLHRPADFQMTMVVPTPKEKLKDALDKYSQKHGIRITSTGTATVEKGPAKAAAASSATGGTGTVTKAGAKPPSPLRVFLQAIGIIQYADKLEKQSVDLDVLEVAEDEDLQNFGITDKMHVKLIRAKLADEEFMQSLSSGKSAPPPASGGAGGGGASAKPPAAAAISFDDDFDIPLPGKASSSGGLTQSSTGGGFIDLDDLDLDLPPPKAGGGGGPAPFSIIDDDLDLDLPPPKPAAGGKSAVIDDI